jgi:hypothetical protein
MPSLGESLRELSLVKEPTALAQRPVPNMKCASI